MSSIVIDKEELLDFIVTVFESCACICDEQHDLARTSSGAARADVCAERIRELAEETMTRIRNEYAVLQ